MLYNLAYTTVHVHTCTCITTYNYFANMLKLIIIKKDIKQTENGRGC